MLCDESVYKFVRTVQFDEAVIYPPAPYSAQAHTIHRVANKKDKTIHGQTRGILLMASIEYFEYRHLLLYAV